ncbi:hypothetical protein J502_1741 [Acinetobacter sp. 1294596]|nr:hypothetical protein J502_1741 [Acinetobacter sp. 1294596]
MNAYSFIFIYRNLAYAILTFKNYHKVCYFFISTFLYLFNFNKNFLYL